MPPTSDHLDNFHQGMRFELTKKHEQSILWPTSHGRNTPANPIKLIIYIYTHIEPAVPESLLILRSEINFCCEAVSHCQAQPLLESLEIRVHSLLRGFSTVSWSLPSRSLSLLATMDLPLEGYVKSSSHFLVSAQA